MRETAQLRDKLHAFYKDVKTEAVMTELFEETEAQNQQQQPEDMMLDYGDE